MNELVQYAELLMGFLQERGPSLNVESQRALGEMLQQILQLIQREAEEPPTTQQQPDLKQAGPSSNVEGFAYDPENNSLYVRFLGEHPNRNGPVYEYDNVPENIFNLFRTGAVPARTNGKNRWGSWWKGKTPSLGASLFTLIKNQSYPYRRVA